MHEHVTWGETAMRQSSGLREAALRRLAALSEAAMRRVAMFWRQVNPPESERLRRRIRGDQVWRLRLYRTLAARYRNDQPFQVTLTKLGTKAAHRARERFALFGRGRWRVRTRALLHWADRIHEHGDLLHQALSGWVPPQEELILAANHTDRGLDRAAWMIEKRLRLGSTAKTAMVYPLFLVVGLLVMVTVLGRTVLPSLLTMREQSGLGTPWMLRFLADWAWVFPLPLCVAIVWVKSSLPNDIGRWRIWLDRNMWPWTAYRLSEGVNFLVAFSAMWQGGMNETAIFSAIAEHGGPWLKERVTAIAWNNKQGSPIGVSMEEAGFGFPDDEIIDELIDHEGDPVELAEFMGKIADEQGTRQDEAMQRFTMIFGLTLMVVTILAILGIALMLVSSFNFSGIEGTVGPR